MYYSNMLYNILRFFSKYFIHKPQQFDLQTI